MDICFKKSITLQRWFDPKGFEIRHFFFSLEKFLPIGEIFGFQWTDSFPPVSCILIASFFPYLVFLRNCRLWKKCVKVWVCLLLIQMSILVSIFTRTPKPSPTPESTAATKTENTHLSFSDSFRLGLHEFFFCGEVRRSVARAHVLIYKENSNIILSPPGIT